jgi:hypothetical protein
MVRWAWRKGIDEFEDMIATNPRDASLVSRVTALLVAVVLLGGVGVASAASQVPEQAAVSAYTLTAGRIAAFVAGMVGLTGAIAGGLAVARNGRRWAIVALALGPIALVIGGLVVATADGGLGTGNGLGGGIVAMAVGLAGMALGGLALDRARRIA